MAKIIKSTPKGSYQMLEVQEEEKYCQLNQLNPNEN